MDSVVPVSLNMVVNEAPRGPLSYKKLEALLGETPKDKIKSLATLASGIIVGMLAVYAGKKLNEYLSKKRLFLEFKFIAKKSGDQEKYTEEELKAAFEVYYHELKLTGGV